MIAGSANGITLMRLLPRVNIRVLVVDFPDVTEIASFRLTRSIQAIRVMCEYNRSRCPLNRFYNHSHRDALSCEFSP